MLAYKLKVVHVEDATQKFFSAVRNSYFYPRLEKNVVMGLVLFLQMVVTFVALVSLVICFLEGTTFLQA